MARPTCYDCRFLPQKMIGFRGTNTHVPGFSTPSEDLFAWRESTGEERRLEAPVPFTQIEQSNDSRFQREKGPGKNARTSSASKLLNVRPARDLPLHLLCALWQVHGQVHLALISKNADLRGFSLRLRRKLLAQFADAMNALTVEGGDHVSSL